MPLLGQRRTITGASRIIPCLGVAFAAMLFGFHSVLYTGTLEKIQAVVGTSQGQVTWGVET